MPKHSGKLRAKAGARHLLGVRSAPAAKPAPGAKLPSLKNRMRGLQRLLNKVRPACWRCCRLVHARVRDAAAARTHA